MYDDLDEFLQIYLMKKWSQWFKTTTVFQLFDAKLMGENERNWFQMQPSARCGRKMIDICEEIAKKGHRTLKNDFI